MRDFSLLGHPSLRNFCRGALLIREMLPRIFQATSATCRALLLMAGLTFCSAQAADSSTTPDSPIGVNLPVELTFPGTGLASVGVYNDHNELIRSLAFAFPVTAGAHKLTWDGTTA